MPTEKERLEEAVRRLGAIIRRGAPPPEPAPEPPQTSETSQSPRRTS